MMSIRYLVTALLLIFFFASGEEPSYVQSYAPVAVDSVAIKLRMADSLARDRSVLQSTLDNSLDSLASMTEYLKWAKRSPHYKVYTYTRPAMKLVYRKDGLKGNYYLVRTVKYEKP